MASDGLPPCCAQAWRRIQTQNAAAMSDGEALRRAVGQVSARFYRVALPPEDGDEPDPVAETLSALVCGLLDSILPDHAAGLLRSLGEKAAADG